MSQVELVLADDDRAAAQAAGGVLHGGEGLGQELVEGLAGLEAGRGIPRSSRAAARR